MTGYPTIGINAAAGNDAYSGAGPATPITGTGAVVQLATAKIGLYDAPNLSTVLADGTHTIQLAYTTSGKVSLVRITGKRETNDTGTCTVDSDGVTVTIDPMPSGLGSGYPIRINGEDSYIASGGSTTVTLGTAVTGNQTGVAYQIPPHVITDATMSNMVAGSYGYAIGGEKASINGTYFRHAVDSGTNGIGGIQPGWEISADTESANITSMTLRVSGTAALPITFRGKTPRATNGDESGMTTLTFTGISGTSPFLCNYTGYYWIFKDFVAKTNVASKQILSGNSRQHTWQGVSIRPGTQQWNIGIDISGTHCLVDDCIVIANLFTRSTIAERVCRATNSLFYSTYTGSNGNVSSYIAIAENCVFKSVNQNYVGSTEIEATNCVFHNLQIWSSDYATRAERCIFYWDSAFSDVAVKINAAGGGNVPALVKDCCYYNATAITGTNVPPDLISGTINENPSFVDAASNDYTPGNANLKGISPYLIPGSTVRAYGNVGVAQNNPAGGGTSGAASFSVRKRGRMISGTSAGRMRYTARNAAGVSVVETVANHTLLLWRGGASATPTNTPSSLGGGVYELLLTAAETTKSATVESIALTGTSSTSGVVIEGTEVDLVEAVSATMTAQGYTVERGEKLDLISTLNSRLTNTWAAYLYTLFGLRPSGGQAMAGATDLAAAAADAATVKGRITDARAAKLDYVPTKAELDAAEASIKLAIPSVTDLAKETTAAGAKSAAEAASAAAELAKTAAQAAAAGAPASGRAPSKAELDAAQQAIIDAIPDSMGGGATADQIVDAWNSKVQDGQEATNGQLLIAASEGGVATVGEDAVAAISDASAAKVWQYSTTTVDAQTTGMGKWVRTLFGGITTLSGWLTAAVTAIRAAFSGGSLTQNSAYTSNQYRDAYCATSMTYTVSSTATAYAILGTPKKKTIAITNELGALVAADVQTVIISVDQFNIISADYRPAVGDTITIDSIIYTVYRPAGNAQWVWHDSYNYSVEVYVQRRG